MKTRNIALNVLKYIILVNLYFMIGPFALIRFFTVNYKSNLKSNLKQRAPNKHRKKNTCDLVAGSLCACRVSTWRTCPRLWSTTCGSPTTATPSLRRRVRSASLPPATPTLPKVLFKGPHKWTFRIKF